MLGVMRRVNPPVTFVLAFAAMLALAMTASCSQQARAADARARSCAEGVATVVARSPHEMREACGAIAQAAAFLARLGVVLHGPIELHLVDALPDIAATPTRTGVYLRDQRRAYVLRRERWPVDAAPFGLPMSRALYRSAIVHEAVHAIIAEHFHAERLDVVAHEYLAYVGQLDALPAALRRRALRAAPQQAGDEARRLNLFVLGMNPDRFAALAWRHWSTPGNARAVVQAVLEKGTMPTV